MKRPAEVKKIAEAESLAPSGLKTYTRSSDGATMVEIAPHSFLNGPHGHRRVTLGLPGSGLWWTETIPPARAPHAGHRLAVSPAA
jgi:hypothetical protein